MRTLALTLTLSLAGACGSSTCDLKAVNAGEMRGTINGELWTASRVTWRQYATGYSVDASTDGGHELYLSMLRDIQGRPVSEAVGERDYPIDVTWDGGGDGAAQFDHSTEGPLGTEPGGWMTMDRLGGGVLEGCFGFTVSSKFETLELEGAFIAGSSSPQGF